MLAFEQGLYRPWLERTSTTTLWVYSALIVVLLPAFHFVLMAIPSMPPDSMTLRLMAAGISAAVGLAVFLFPALRRYASEPQVVNVLPVAVVVPILVAIVSAGYFIAVLIGSLRIRI
jgi:hypothetical protein